MKSLSFPFSVGGFLSICVFIGSKSGGLFHRGRRGGGGKVLTQGAVVSDAPDVRAVRYTYNPVSGMHALA